MKNQKRVKVAILGCTGSVGQKFVELLTNHPWFEITELCASDKSAGKSYKDTVDWFLSTPIPEGVKNIQVHTCEPVLKSKVVFPGFIDLHTHLWSEADKIEFDLSGISTYQETVRKLGEFIASKKKDEWVFASGWDESIWSDKKE